MPDDTKPAEGFPDANANNDDVSRKLADQNLQKSFTIEDITDTTKSLDALAEKLQKEKEEGGSDEGVVEPKTPVTPAPTDEEAKKLADEAAAKAAEETAKREADLKSAETFFKDTPNLPPNASPKSTEAFSTVKIKAAQEISAREAKIAELSKQLTEAQEKLKNPVPPEVEREIKELREWRAKLDVEADPKFKEFDKGISSAHDFIYAQLKKTGLISDTTIDEIKKYGGPEKVNMTKIFDLIKDPMTQRLVESKLADIEMAHYNKAQAIKSVKENIGQYMQDRTKQFEESVASHNAATRQHLDSYLGKLDWFKEKPIDDKADEATKKSVQAHNKFVVETQQQLQEALNDDTPEMRAIMITGMAQLFRLQQVNAGNVAKISELEKSNKEMSDKLARLTKVATSRPKEGGAPPNGQLPVVKKDADLNVRTSDALDEHMKQIMEKRAALANA
jgi:hypothetical protein